jgi:hypothetical protein
MINRPAEIVGGPCHGPKLPPHQGILDLSFHTTHRNAVPRYSRRDQHDLARLEVLGADLVTVHGGLCGAT